ncbi:MAG: alpha/beta hydrolase [Gemmatimonadota bacterium]|nr:alpha/beta hydrolase [Gemmatimonadota bacterium]
MNAGVKWSIFVFFASVMALAATVIFWCSWYSSIDHTEKIHSRHKPLLSAQDFVLADSGRYEETLFTLTDRNGRVFTGHLRKPVRTEGSLPAIFIMGGVGTGAKAVRLVNLDQPAVLCAMDYPPYTKGKIKLAELPGMVKTVNSAAEEAVDRTFNVLDYLCSRQDVDTSRVSVLGASFGVPFAVVAAALDPRVKGLVLIHGTADLEGLIDWSLKREVPFAPLRKASSKLLGALVSPYEPASYIGLVAPRPLLMINSREDQRIPIPGVELLYEKAAEPKELIWQSCEHIHPTNRELIESLTSTAAVWLEKKGLL